MRGPVRRAGSRRPTGLLTEVGRRSLLGERDAPQGEDFIPPPFEDGGFRGNDLRGPRVVDADFFRVEECEIARVAHFAGAHKWVEDGIRHHVVRSPARGARVP